MIEIDAQLFARAKESARRSRQSVSQLIAEALDEKLAATLACPLAESDPAEAAFPIHPEVRTITGLVPGELDAKAVYAEHLVRRCK